MKQILVDKKYRRPRIWSNKELSKFSHLFTGKIINVSAWKDQDKEGDYYKNYFVNADTYSLSNYKSEARGFQGKNNEFYLDLTEDLDKKLYRKYDVVFNHTTLEHIYDFRKAFKNICSLSKDIVIVVVPFLQQMHAHYGDFWRFTPTAVKKMFDEEGFRVLYSSFNEGKHESVYLFFIASRTNKWNDKISNKFTFSASKKDFLDSKEQFVGNRAITNNYVHKIFETGKKLLITFVNNFK